ncbi:TPA: hypothetical protein ACN31Q_000631 [Vibrio campbellii]
MGTTYFTIAIIVKNTKTMNRILTLITFPIWIHHLT